MNCKKCRENLFLYDDLSFSERQQTDKHLASCDACQKTFEEVRNTQAIVRAAAGIKAELSNPEALTRSVMAKIHSSDQQKPAVFELAIGHLFARFAMTAVSCFLFFFFVWEQLSLPREQVRVSLTGKSATLNTSSMLKKLEARNTQAREPLSLYASAAGLYHRKNKNIQTR